MLSTRLSCALIVTLLAANAPGQLAADFSAAPTSGINPLTVAFTDTTTGGTPIGWQWNFGDGGTSSDQHPVHIYTAPGTYTVALYAFTLGGFDLEQKDDLIFVAPAPLVVDFTATPTQGVNPLTVQFADTSTGTPITAWSWDFGDGATSTQQSPVHTYEAGQTTSFTVSLTAYVEQQGDTLVKADLITVDPAPLVADFVATPVQGVNPLVVSFTDLSTGATVDAWSWDFGDGTSSSFQHPTKKYDAPGAYTVSLTAWVGPQSETVVKSDLVTVDPATFTVDFTATPTEGVNPLVVSFTDASSGAAFTGWSWDFGDGTYSSGQPVTTHVYYAPGPHDVTLTVFVGQQTASKTEAGLVTVERAPLTLPVFPARTYRLGNTGRDLVIGDLDDDGVPDVVVRHGPFFAPASSLLGQGDGGFEYVGLLGVGPSPSDIALADFDGDGVQDMAMAEAVSDQVSVLSGHGDGSFGPAASFAVGDGPMGIAAGDVDGDGDQDLVAALSGDNEVAVLLGDGSGGFVPGGTFAVGGTQPQRIVLAHLDGDARLDLLTLDMGALAGGSPVPGSQGVSVLLGKGDGTFVFGSALSLGGVLARAITLGDFDGDGLLDGAVARESPDGVSILDNQGNGSFVAGESIDLASGSWPRSIEAADLDGDGLLDLVTGDILASTASVLTGQGAGSFSFEHAYSAGWQPAAVAVVDVDGDGALDLLTAGLGRTMTVLRGDGDGGFMENTPYPVGADPRSIAVGDFDGDAVQDLVTADFAASTVTTLLGAGDGSFASGATVGVGTGPYSVAVADFDGNGVQDLATADNNAHTATVLLGQGDGGFVPAGAFAVGTGPKDIAVGDFDGDGTPDLATADSLADTVTLLIGVGDGSFTSSATLAVGLYPASLAVADLDDDGAQDLITADRFGDTVSVLLGHGDGGFDPATSYPVGLNASGIAVGDLDGDGTLDLATAVSTGPGVAILRGQGDGTFADVTSTIVPSSLGSVAVTDVDGDDDLDLVTSSGYLGAVGILLGDGTGAFVDNGQFGGISVSNEVAIGDFDGDGRPDVAAASLGLDAAIVLLNQLDAWTHLGSGLPGASGIPYLEGTGTLEIGSAGDLSLSNAAPSSRAVLFVATSSAPTPFKCGTLVPVPALTSVLLQTDPGGTLDLAWPSWPAGLSGQSLYMQYAVQNAAAVCGAALSNALRADVP